MTVTILPAFQIHWSLVPPEDAAGFVSRGCRLLAVWPTPVNHDACFEEAGFTLFGENDEVWDRAAEELLGRIIEKLSQYGTIELASKPLRDKPPWPLRLFRAGQELPLQQQALLPMQWDVLPPFQARFGDSGSALRTGNGHFLLWVNLPGAEPDAFEFVKSVAGPWTIIETALSWKALLPSSI